MITSKKFILKRSVWILLSVFFVVFFIIALLGNSIANDYAPAIHGYLGTNPYKKIIRSEASGPEIDYYKSDYTKKDGEGNTIYQKDGDDVLRPVYDDEAMRANSQDVALQAAVEGTVILSNDDALPLEKNTRVSLFGISSVNYQFLGVGSGGMTVSTPLGMDETFANYELELNSDLYWKYFNLFSAGNGKYTQVRCREVNEVPWSEIQSTVNATVETGDVAVIIVSRVAGEKWDVVPTGRDEFMDPENFLDLSVDEYEVIRNLLGLRDSGKFSKVVLLLNSANPFQFEHIKDLDLDACVWVGMGGTMAYEQIATTLSGRGKYAVSGKLSNVYVYNNYSAPATVNFGEFTWSEYGNGLPDPDNNQMGLTYNTKYVAYQENIYVGYRYYETRYEDSVLGLGNADDAAGSILSSDGWKYSEEVAYPFGYGLSYTEFTHSGFEVTENKNGDYEVSVNIKNDGGHDGKDVLQVYVQKPYTSYDKEHGIEKASVELAGFAKTDLLAPGEDQTITVTVKAEQLKTYDADGQRTYILEAGDYYIAAGENSHDALNNILAAKGKTTADGMDYNGNAEFTKKITVDKDDHETYRYSSTTGAEITNRFDDVDINRYEGADQSITYLSRDDWAATYPKKAVSLKCTSEQMIEDMQYGHEPNVNEGDEMPVYGTVTSPNGELSLAMLMDIDFGDELWQNLLDQMTLEEQEYLISYGLHHIAGVESVGAPGLQARDGPGGMKTGNPTLKTTLSFPSEVTMAATFNTEVIGRLGEAFGLEVLHTYYTIIYAPGACLHRCAFGGRNWEYFSEDGFLSGKMLAVECAGIQKYGVIVETKHFVLNEQETVRHGVATFATEQSFRELYLKAFEIGVTEGNLNGIMTSFNRIGCTWVGANKNLLTEVLRGEWGFDGIIETDSCLGASDNLQHIVHPYAVAEGLMAGNDLWMCGTGDEKFIEELEDNPTVMLALREACHRLLYAQLHSNGMNGMDETTQIIKVKVWWQLLIDGITIATGIIAVLLILFSISSFVVCSERFKRFVANRKTAKATAGNAATNGDVSAKMPLKDRRNDERPVAHTESAGEPSGSGTNGGGFWGKIKMMSVKKKIFAIISAVLVVTIVTLSIVLPLTLSGKDSPDEGINPDPPATHVCEHVCPICGKCTDPDCDDPVCAEKCAGHAHECESKCEICGKCYNIYCEEEVCAEKCGEGREENFFEAEDARLFNGKGTLAIKFNGDNGETYVDGFNKNMGASIAFDVYSYKQSTASLVVYLSRRTFDFKMSNMLIQVNEKSIQTNSVVPGTGDQEKWREFIPVNLGCVNLEEGNNTISFTVISNNDDSGLNFDKIALLGDHMCHNVCPICGKCTDPDCTDPACAEKCEGHIHTCQSVCPICGKCYDLFCDDEACADKCGEGGTEEVYEAEEAALKGGIKGDLETESGNNGVVYISQTNSNEGASITFTVNSEKDKVVSLSASVSRRSIGISLTSDAFAITVNGTKLTTESGIPKSGTGKDDWRNFVTVGLGCVRLVQGENTIVFTVLPGSEKCVNLDSITLTSADATPEPPVHVCEHVCPICGKCTDPDCTDPVCAEKCEGHETEQHTCEHVCPTCGKCYDLFCDDPVCAEKCGDGLVPTVYEAENAVLGAGVKGNLKTESGNNVTYVAGTNGNEGASVTFTVKSDKEQTASLIASVSRRSGEISLTGDAFAIEVNGTKLVTESAIPASETGSDDWRNFVDVGLGCVNLISGENTIKLTVLPGSEMCVNLDKITLLTEEGLPQEKTLVLEAENGIYRPTKKIDLQSAGTGLVLGINTLEETTIDFAVYAEKECVEKLYVSLSRRATVIDGVQSDILIKDVYKIIVNGVEFDTGDAAVVKPDSGDSQWKVYDEVYLGDITLKSGLNTITFAVATTEDKGSNIDYLKLLGEGNVTEVDLNTEFVLDDQKFEAEFAQAFTESGDAVTPDKDVCTAQDGVKSMMIGTNGKLNATVTFTVKADETKTSDLYAAVTQRANENVPFSEVYKVTVNGEEQTVSGNIPFAGNNWRNSEEVKLCTLELQAGTEYTITFTVITSEDKACNFDYIRLVSAD